MGICQMGTQTCITTDGEFGYWDACTGFIGPEPEICGDGIDSDCDGSDLACPVAACSVDPVEARMPALLTWSSQGSNDPSGRALTAYTWTVVSFPPGSGASLDGSGPERTTRVDQPGSYTAQLVVVNDRGESSQPCTATAIISEPEQPVAVCSVSPTQAHSFDTLTWHGDASHDPSGQPLADYQWSVLSFPPGSTAGLMGSGPTRTTQTDMAGAYTAQLVVVSQSGQSSAPCTATATVVPSENLWVEMYWRYPEDDMDLHLLAPYGELDTDTDCYYINCIPPSILDWGQPGNQSDNPSLDLDDIPGTGPENINIEAPAPGTYTVVVHDFPSYDRFDPNPVTVNIYIDGNPVATFERDMIGEDDSWRVCTIEWPSGMVHAL
jgi:hypothetical protein